MWNEVLVYGYVGYKSLKILRFLPTWFVANCSSMLSSESMKGVAIIPALFLAKSEKTS